MDNVLPATLVHHGSKCWVWLQALGFQSAQNPGRMIRVLHTLVRTVLVTFRVSPPSQQTCSVLIRKCTCD